MNKKIKVLVLVSVLALVAVGSVAAAPGAGRQETRSVRTVSERSSRASSVQKRDREYRRTQDGQQLCLYDGEGMPELCPVTGEAPLAMRLRTRDAR